MISGPVIAVVDDDVSVRQSLGSLLRSLDMTVALYDGGPALLGSTELERIGCVVTDIQMPAMNGLALCAALRARGMDVPVIFMTAFPEERYRAQAAELGAFCFLNKPLEEDEILHCIERALGRPSGPDEAVGGDQA